eukprot:1143925-Pelagomonas_calceolata.AAC.2
MHCSKLYINVWSLYSIRNLKPLSTRGYKGLASDHTTYESCYYKRQATNGLSVSAQLYCCAQQQLAAGHGFPLAG